MKKLPIFKALIANEEDKMMTISLVDFPATEADFLAFDKQNERVMFSVENEEKRLVRGLVMAANQLIYRFSPNFGEYYIMYEPETIRQMAEKYLKDGFQNNVDLMHDGQLVDGVNMVQFFIKDTENGINPKPFEDYEDGSLFAEFHIENDDVWAQIKDGDFKGFSLEGFFSIEPMEFSKQENNENKETKKMSKVSKLKELLKAMLEVFGEVSTDKGVILWDTDEDLKEGDTVYTLNEDGERENLADGEYTSEDGKVITIADNVVTEIKDDEAEIAPEEPTEEQENEEEEVVVVEPEEEPTVDERDTLIEELKARIAELEAENQELKDRIAELEAEPAAPSAEEEFSSKETNENPEIAKLRKRGYQF